jgi:thioredoxin-related protein
MPTRRTFITALLSCTGSGVAWARDGHLPRPTSLADSAQAAVKQGEPLVVLMSLPGCPYCELVRRNYLIPMRQSEGLHVVQLDVTERRQKVLDFAGQASNGYALSRAWASRVTPTVLFFDDKGREIAPRLEGVAVPDFYDSYLQERLSTARAALRAVPTAHPAASS